MLNKELADAIKNNRVSHAYLFLNEEDAFEFAKALNVAAVDFIVQEDLLTKDIEGLQAQLKFKPYGNRRVVLLKHADDMQTIVQNKLLKTLEEPLGNTVIILSAERRDALLPTILSRCTQVAALDKALEIDDEAMRIAKDFIACDPQFNLRKAIVTQIEDKALALDFLNALEDIYREELIKNLNPEEVGKKIKLTEETRKNIKSGYSMGYALKALALNI